MIDGLNLMETWHPAKDMGQQISMNLYKRKLSTASSLSSHYCSTALLAMIDGLKTSSPRASSTSFL
jgi:hypothetical protein